MIALAVALVFEINIALERIRAGEMVHHHRVVDHQIHRHQRIDALGVRAELRRRIAHGGKVHHRRNAGEVLHQHARRRKRDFHFVLAAVLQPAGNGRDVVLLNRHTIFGAQQVFQEHLERIGQARDVAEAVARSGVEVEIGVRLAAGAERSAAAERVERRHGCILTSGVTAMRNASGSAPNPESNRRARRVLCSAVRAGCK